MITYYQLKDSKWRKQMFNTYEYRLPSSAKERMIDFYFMSCYGRGNKKVDEITRFNLEFVTDNAIDKMHREIIEEIKFSIICEFRHIYDRNHSSIMDNMSKEYKSFIKHFYKNFMLEKSYNTHNEYLLLDTPEDNFFTTTEHAQYKREIHEINERYKVYKSFLATEKELKFSKSMISDLFEYIFFNLEWNSSYGGVAWGGIAKGYTRLLKCKNVGDKIIAIDHVYDLQHNTGTVFNKLYRYKINGDYCWIKEVLDWKKELKEVSEFDGKLSIGLTPIFNYLHKVVCNKTIITVREEIRAKIKEEQLRLEAEQLQKMEKFRLYEIKRKKEKKLYYNRIIYKLKKINNYAKLKINGKIPTYNDIGVFMNYNAWFIKGNWKNANVVAFENNNNCMVVKSIEWLSDYNGHIVIDSADKKMKPIGEIKPCISTI